MPVDLLVVGLGNPGAEYARTRHNVGADVVELLARRHGGKLHGSKGRARSDEVRIGDRRVALAIPLTYMNDSGEAVAGMGGRLGLGPDQIVMVHDEAGPAPGADCQVTTASDRSSSTSTPTRSCASASAWASRRLRSAAPTTCCRASRSAIVTRWM